MTRYIRYAVLIGLLLPVAGLAQEAAVPAAPAEVQSELPAMVQISGVSTLVDYAAVGRLLGTVEGVRRVDVIEADGATVTFRVMVRGGSATLDHALENAPQFARSSASGGRLVYEYRH